MAAQVPLCTAFLYVGLIGLVLPGCGPRSERPGPTRVTKEPPQVDLNTAVLLSGTSSCSGRSCHSELEPRNSKNGLVTRYAYTRWLHYDPHANAYHVLTEELAKTMAERLGIASVTDDPRCLGCHVTPQAAAESQWAREERVHGVGCESCHGPAIQWQEPHRDEVWRKLDSTAKQKEYAKVGMTWLPSLSVRAQVCAGCHVGALASSQGGMPAREVTHEFIAAGHPRLMFEFGAFQANMPKHWVEKDVGHDFEARAWVVGQVVSAQAALQLLSERASPKRSSQWPEFGDYDCYACHHSLYGISWRQRRGYPAGRAGASRLAQWYFALIPVASAKELTLGYLESSNMPSWPSSAEVREQALMQLEKLGDLAPKLEKATFNRKNLERLRGRLVARAVGRLQADWDEMEQIALGLVAVNEAARSLRKHSGDPDGPRDLQIEEATRDLLKLLAFPAGYNSPQTFRQTAQFDQQVQAIFARLK